MEEEGTAKSQPFFSGEAAAKDSLGGSQAKP